MALNKYYTFAALAGLMVVLIAAAMPPGGTNRLEVVVCLSVLFAGGWLGWQLFIEGKSQLAQIENLIEVNEAASRVLFITLF